MTATAPIRISARSQFLGVAFTLLVLLVGANMPSPLYAGYEHSFGFSPVVLTLVFATYVGTLVPALCLAAPLADTLGYRVPLVLSLVLAAGAMALFAAATGLGWLFAARAVQGVAVGMGSGTAASALVATAPENDRNRASLLASLVTTVGNGIGPVLTGLIASYLPLPTRLCYLVEIALCVAAAVVASTLPSGLGALGHPWRPRVPRVPTEVGAQFRAAATVSFLTWAVTALCLALVPSYLASFTGSHNLVLAGLSSGLILLAASLAQVVSAGWSTRTAQVIGLALLVAGLLGLVPAGALHSAALVLTCCVVAGIGQGPAFMGAMRQVNQATTERTRGGVLAAFYGTTYAGFGVPVIGVGLLATVLDTPTAVHIFIAAFTPMTLAVIYRIVRREADH